MGLQQGTQQGFLLGGAERDQGHGFAVEPLGDSTVLIQQEGLLRPLLEAHLEHTGSTRAAQILADWPNWKGRFKVVVPPSEKALVGLEERQAVVA